MRAHAPLALALVTALAAGCPSGSCRGSETTTRDPAAPPPGVDPTFTLIATTELRGQLEPCGCSSDPHGDISRTAHLVERARQAGDVIYIDGGSTTYSSPTIEESRAAQETKRARFVAELMEGDLGAAAVGLGPYDLSEGPGAVAPARAAVNIEGEPALATAAPEVTEAGGSRIGIFGVVSEGALAEAEGAEDLAVTDPARAAADATSALRGDGADVVIAIAHMTSAEATDLASGVDGIDFVLVGQNAPEPDGVDPAARQVGDTWVFQPANRGQVVTRIDVGVGGGDGFRDAVGPARAEAERERLRERVAAIERDLDEWRDDPDADPDFLAAREAELAELENELEALGDDPLRLPDEGSWFVLSQIPMTTELDCHEGIQARKTDLDEAIGKANLELLAGEEPPPPADGEAHYVGAEACRGCHFEAAEFWEETSHAAAWETLEDYGKQYDLDCVSCHVTGYDEPGGSTLAHNEGLRDVQCEVCHGPGSLHVDAQGDEDTFSVARTPPEELCVACHNEEHSDTFAYDAYLRSVTGEGHGEAFREQLGDGATGRELRSEALAEADQGTGQGCLK